MLPQTVVPAVDADIVSSTLGNWGRWQLRTVFLVYVCKIPSAWFMACIIFTAPLPQPGEFFCQFERSTLRTADANTDAVVTDQCWRQNPAALDWPGNGTVVDDTVGCSAFQHNTTFTSLVTQFDLVCSRSILVAVTQFLHLFGVLVGGILATKLLEIQSPRYVMLLGMVTQIGCGCVTGLTDQFEMHCFFRFLSAVCCAQMYTAGQMIFSDITGGQPRTIAVGLFETFWSLGVILLPLLAWLQPNWTGLYLLISLPTCAYIGLWYLIPDSPRWLLRHGRIDEAHRWLVLGATVNAAAVGRAKQSIAKRGVSDDLLERLRAVHSTAAKAPAGDNWWLLWHKQSAQTIVSVVAAHVAWAVFVTNYNGMLVNVKAFGRDWVALNTICLGVCEIVGVAIGVTLIVKTKRKWLWAGLTNVVAGLATFLAFLLPTTLNSNESTAVLMLLAGFAKFGVSVAQSMLFACTGELVAPERRPMMLFSCVVWARLWLLGAPFIAALVGIHQSLPLVSFGALSAGGGLATTLLSKWKS